MSKSLHKREFGNVLFLIYRVLKVKKKIIFEETVFPNIIKLFFKWYDIL